MAILHLIRCDGPQCGVEEQLSSVQARHPGAALVFTRPPRWPTLDGLDFHSWGCVSNYSIDRQQEDEEKALRAS